MDKNFGDSLRRIHGEATSITATEVVVKPHGAEESETISFDYLVIATGSSTPFPFKDNRSDSEASKSLMRSLANSIKSANRITLVGGGPSSVELAGEILQVYPKKAVTIIHSGPKLLSGNNLKDKTMDMADRKAKALGINVLYNQRADLDALRSSASASGATEGKDSEATKTEEGEENTFTSGSGEQSVYVGPVTVKTQDGEHAIESDLVFTTPGQSTNSAAFTDAFASAIGKQDRLIVNDYLQVKGYDNVFAVGDAALANEARLMYVASEQAKLLGSNLVKILKAAGAGKPAPKLKAWKAMKPVMFVPLGSKDGVGQLPNGMVVGKKMVPMAKGKGLFASDVKKRVEN